MSSEMPFFYFVRKHLGEAGREWLFLVHCGELVYPVPESPIIPGYGSVQVVISSLKWRGVPPGAKVTGYQFTYLQIARDLIASELAKYHGRVANG